MIVCDLILGNCYPFQEGLYCTEFTEPPNGYHSIKAKIKNGYEYVLYNHNQIYPKFVIYYRYNNVNQTMNPLADSIKPVHITAPLFTYFEKLKKKFPQFKEMLQQYMIGILNDTIEVGKFLTEFSNYINEKPPIDFEERLKKEVLRCKENLFAQSSKNTINVSIPPNVSRQLRDSIHLAIQTTIQSYNAGAARPACPAAAATFARPACPAAAAAPVHKCHCGQHF